MDKKQGNISLKIAAIEEENRELSGKIKALETKNYLKAYFRRENIKFENINEFKEDSDKENTKQVLHLFMETELGFMDASSVEIQQVHQLRKKKENGPKPILARFFSLESLLSPGALASLSREKPQYFHPYDFYDFNYYYYFVNIYWC